VQPKSESDPAEPAGVQLDGLTRISVREARRSIAELLNRAAYGVERIVVERHGRPIAAIVCVEDLEFLERTDRESDRRMLTGAGRTRRARARPASPRPR
jgi:prevent-host-death family protein